MDEQGWRPIHANHAIEKCVATIGFEEPLTGEYLQSKVLPAAEAAAAQLGMKSVIQQIFAAQIEIDASGAVLRAPQRQPPLNGAAYIPFTWQTNYFHLDLTQTRRLSDALHMFIQDLRFELDVSGAMTLTSIWEMIDGTQVPANNLKGLGFRL